MITSTPLDDLDLSQGLTYQASHRTFASPGSRYARNFDSRIGVTAYLAWCLNSANVRDITVHIYHDLETWPVSTLTIARPHNLAPWTCPGLPDWTPDTGEAVANEAVVEAMTIIAQHQRRAI